MVTQIPTAIAWSVSRLLGVPEEQPPADGVEHAHWDAAGGRWLVREKPVEPAGREAA